MTTKEVALRMKVTCSQQWQALMRRHTTTVKRFRNGLRRMYGRFRLFLKWTKGTSAQWIIVLSALILGVLSIVIVNQYPPVEISASDARATLISLAQILTTILAISVSLLMVSLQFISRSYTPRAMKILFKDPLLIGYLAAYTLSIFLILILLAMAFVPLQIFRVYAVFITIFCIVYLLVLLFRIPSLLHPSYVIRRLAKRVPDNFCQKLVDRKGRPFTVYNEALLDIEEAMIRSIVQNELQPFLIGIRFLNSFLGRFLSATERDLNAAERKKDIREGLSDVFGYFLIHYRRMVNESLLHAREEHLIYLCQSLSDYLIHLQKLKAFRAFEYVAEVYDYAGICGVDQKLVTFSDYFMRSLSNLVNVQMSILDEPLPHFDDDLKNLRWADLSEEEQDLRTIKSIMVDFDLSDRMRYLSRLAETAAVRKLDSIVSFSMHILSEALDKVLSLKSIGKKRWFTASILYIIVETHKKCLQNGINSTTYTNLLPYKIESMKDSSDVAEFGGLLTSEFSRIAMLSIDNGFYEELSHWGAIGRSLVKSHPDLAMVVIDVLENGLKVMKPRITRENVWYYAQARKDLESLRDWDAHPHQKIRHRVDKVLVEYGAITV